MNRFLKSIGFATQGLILFFTNEKNGRIQLVIAGLVTGFGIYVQLRAMEWVAILMCCILVLALEMVNSCIEMICNKIEPENDEMIATIKDIAAGAVFLASIVSVIIGCIIFYPYILFLL